MRSATFRIVPPAISVAGRVTTLEIVECKRRNEVAAVVVAIAAEMAAFHVAVVAPRTLGGRHAREMEAVSRGGPPY